jgi:hypothetical protein
LPILLSVLVLSLLAIVSAGVISVKKQLHNYAIYHICGLPWKQCVFISMGYSASSCLAALLISWLGMGVLRWTGWLQNMAWNLGIWEFFSCVVMALLFVAISLFMPMIVLNGVTAKDVLREETF